MFRLDAQHTGRSGYVLPHAPGIVRKWHTGGRVSSQPAVLPDGTIVFGSHDGMVYGVRRESDDFRFRLNTGDRVYPSPLVVPQPDGGVTRTYLGSDADRFFSFTPRGNLLIALGVSADADTSAVMASDGSLRFTAGNVLYAVDGDVNVLWRLDFPSKLFSSPAVMPDGTAVFGCQNSDVYAVDPLGNIRWKTHTGDDVDATPAIDLSPHAPHATVADAGSGPSAGVVYIGSDDGTLYALRGDTGDVLWKRHVRGYIRTGVAIGLDGTLVVGTFGSDVRVIGIDRQNGSVRWTVPITSPPSEDFGIMSSAIVDRQGRFAIGTPDDQLLILSSSGQVEARITLPADVDGSPVLIDDGLLAVGCDDGSVYLLSDDLPDAGVL